MSCEVCDTEQTVWQLRDGSSLDVCPKCSHIERNLVAAPANHRDAAYGGDPGLDRVRLGLTWRALMDAAPLERGSRVFEIGFGAGAMLARFHESGHTVGGCDPDQLEVAVDPRVQASELTFSTGIEDVPTSAEGFDLVYGIHVIEHVEDIHRTVGAARDLLTPGGRLMLMTPGADSWSLKVFSDAWWLLEDPTHIRFFSCRSIRELLERAGFVDICVTPALADNLTMEGASVARLFTTRPPARGVLANRFVRWFAMGVAPVALLLRSVMSRWRPTLVVTARRPEVDQ